MSDLFALNPGRMDVWRAQNPVQKRRHHGAALEASFLDISIGQASPYIISSWHLAAVAFSQRRQPCLECPNSRVNDLKVKRTRLSAILDAGFMNHPKLATWICDGSDLFRFKVPGNIDMDP